MTLEIKRTTQNHKKKKRQMVVAYSSKLGLLIILHSQISPNNIQHENKNLILFAGKRTTGNDL